MATLGRVSALAVFLAGCQSFTTPPGCLLGRATSLPLKDEGNKLYVTSTLNSQPVDLILDTGSSMTTVTRSTAARLKLSLLPSGITHNIGGPGINYLFLARNFQLGTLRGRDIVLTAGDFDLMSNHGRVDGLLGDNFLAAYDVDLDFPEQKVILYRPSRGCVGPVTTLSGDVYDAPLLAGLDRSDPHPLVNVRIGETNLRAAIDTGAPVTVMFADAAARVGLQAADLNGDPRFRTGGLGPYSVAAIRHVMRPLSIGGITVSRLPVSILNQHSLDGVDMILGLDFLRHVHAWLSFSSHTFLMQYPPKPSGVHD